VPKTLSGTPLKTPKNDTIIQMGQFFALNDTIPHCLFLVTPSSILLAHVGFSGHHFM
jgi:hypothetical protein